jgi:hypothetical protein
LRMKSLQICLTYHSCFVFSLSPNSK